MKYKVGDEVLVKAKITGYLSGCALVRFMGANKEEYDFCPDPSSIYESPMTAEEAWEIAIRICLDRTEAGFKGTELAEIFGDNSTYHIMYENTPQQAKAKIKAWEAEKEIKVGDVVKDCNGKIGVVISKGTSDNVLFSDGSTWNYTERTLEKIGSHIDVDWLLKKIGENE